MIEDTSYSLKLLGLPCATFSVDDKVELNSESLQKWFDTEIKSDPKIRFDTEIKSDPKIRFHTKIISDPKIRFHTKIKPEPEIRFHI